jgi:hypothetical protein
MRSVPTGTDAIIVDPNVRRLVQVPLSEAPTLLMQERKLRNQCRYD